MTHDDVCKIEEKAEELHVWAHACLKVLSRQDLHTAHEVGNKIIDMLNELPYSNPVKFLALFEAIGVGADMLEHTMYRPESTVTIN